MRRLIAVIATLALAGCETSGEPEGGPQFALVGSGGQVLGQVRMWETPGGVTFRIAAAGLPPGIHGIHVHPIGRCDPPDFNSAGTHWNPTGRQHGLNNPAGPHAGDMPNVTVGANGTLEKTITNTAVTLGAGPNSLFANGGTALVVHAKADDLKTDPAGNAGDRIACGVISKAP